MELSEWMETDFGDAGAARLGQAAGVGAEEARRALREGLPVQVRALAAHARTPQGAAGIAEAVQNLPAFPSVGAALDDPQGAGLLTQAGELLSSALPGTATGDGLTGKLLQMALPLTLSFLGQRGLREDNAATFLAELVGEGRDSSAPPAPEPGATSPRVVIAAAPGPATVAPRAPEGPLTSAGLLDFLRTQFDGGVAGRLGAAAGFNGNTAARATGAALPVVLGAVARRGGTEAGAADLLARSRDLDRLLGQDGGLNAALLADPTETARLEGQGRGLLGPLLGNVDAVTGRLGSAIGGSGASAGRLLALLVPLVLALIGRRARAENLGPGPLAPLLAGMGGGLAGLLPPGLTGLTPLLAPEMGVAPAEPAPTPRRSPAPPPTTPEAPRRRRGLPWWLIPLLVLLLLGAWYLLQRRPAVPGTGVSGTVGSTVTFAAPAPEAPLSPATFTLAVVALEPPTRAMAGADRVDPRTSGMTPVTENTAAPGA